MHETDDEPGLEKDNISLDWSKDIIDGLTVARAFLDDCESSDQVGSRWFSLLQKTQVSTGISVHGPRK
jgi:hypothetical protein